MMGLDVSDLGPFQRERQVQPSGRPHRVRDREPVGDDQDRPFVTGEQRPEGPRVAADRRDPRLASAGKLGERTVSPGQRPCCSPVSHGDGRGERKRKESQAQFCRQVSFGRKCFKSGDGLRWMSHWASSS